MNVYIDIVRIALALLLITFAIVGGPTWVIVTLLILVSLGLVWSLTPLRKWTE